MKKTNQNIICNGTKKGLDLIDLKILDKHTEKDAKEFGINLKKGLACVNFTYKEFSKVEKKVNPHFVKVIKKAFSIKEDKTETSEVETKEVKTEKVETKEKTFQLQESDFIKEPEAITKETEKELENLISSDDRKTKEVETKEVETPEEVMTVIEKKPVITKKTKGKGKK